VLASGRRDVLTLLWLTLPIAVAAPPGRQNFEKFLINKQGDVVARFSSMATPASIEPEIEKLL
jgi:glutathione peroxidase-family protein